MLQEASLSSSLEEAEAAKVSIIIPVFNRPSMLKHALSSIRQQTYSKIEIIVVDDGSDEDSAREYTRLAEAFGEAQEVKLIRKANGGAASARNAGILASSGDYIYFLDSDDLIFPESIEALVCALTGSGESYCIGRVVEVDYSLRRNLGETHRDGSGNIMRNAQWCTHASLYRKSAVLAVGGFDDSLRNGEDTIFQIKMKLKYGDGARCNAFVGARRRHKQGHLSFDGGSADDRARFLVAAADLISRHDAFLNERRAVRLRSIAAFLFILARIRRRRWEETDHAFELVANILLHDSRLGLTVTRWLSVPDGQLRLLAVFLLLYATKRLRSAASGLTRLTSRRGEAAQRLSNALSQLSRTICATELR